MNEVTNFVETLRRVHEDNGRVEHFARYPGGDGERSTMYLTPFVYEFFIYNGLYQIDWQASCDEGELRRYTPGKEEDQQDKFEAFLSDRTRNSPELIYRAFIERGNISTDGDWTRIIPDRRIKTEEGRTFFGTLSRLQEKLRTLNRKPTEELHQQIFTNIRTCRLFIYDVRCNIFHGRKTLADAYDEDQNKRIEVYYLFLAGLLTLFFNVMDKEKQSFQAQ